MQERVKIFWVSWKIFNIENLHMIPFFNLWDHPTYHFNCLTHTVGPLHEREKGRPYAARLFSLINMSGYSAQFLIRYLQGCLESMYEASSYLDFDNVLGSLTLTAFGGSYTTLHYTTLHYTWRNNNWQGAGFGGPLVMTMFEGP